MPGVFKKKGQRGRKKYRRFKPRSTYISRRVAYPRSANGGPPAAKRARQIRTTRAVAFPLQRFVKIKYFDDSFTLTGDIAGLYQGFHIFSGNSPFDPDYSGVGVQPYFWDQLTGGNMYQRYFANAAKITIYPTLYGTFANTTRVRCFLCAIRRSAPLSFRDPSDLSATSGMKQMVIAPEAQKQLKISMYRKTKQVTPTSMHTAVGGTTYDANPNLPWYFHFYVDGVEHEQEWEVTFSVKIVYYLKLLRENNQNES